MESSHSVVYNFTNRQGETQKRRTEGRKEKDKRGREGGQEKKGEKKTNEKGKRTEEGKKKERTQIKASMKKNTIESLNKGLAEESKARHAIECYSVILEGCSKMQGTSL